MITEPSFIEWLDPTSAPSRILWLHGTAACGKSVLCSFVIDYLVRLEYRCQYFFVRFEDDSKRSPAAILRALAFQIAAVIPEYLEELRKIDIAAIDPRSADYRTVWQWLFQKTLLKLHIKGPLFWVIDGLDEAIHADAFIRLLADLQSSSLPIRIVLVSRKLQTLTTAIHRLEKHVFVKSLQIEGNRDDIESYIAAEMYVNDNDLEYRRYVTSKILERAQGNFLWVRLAVEKINHCHTTDDVDTALHDLPPGMEALYSRMLDSLQKRDSSREKALAISILSWIVYSTRPLSIDELNDALGHGLLDIRKTIAELCEGLVTVDAVGQVAMIHETAREYLMQDHSAETSLLDPKMTHNMLYQRCIKCLTEPSLRGQISRNKSPPLLRYAATSWSSHLNRGSMTDSENLSILQSFLTASHVLTWINTLARHRHLGSIIAASRHLSRVASKLQKSQADRNMTMIENKVMNSTSSWATDLVQVVGKFGRNLIDDPDTIYRMIPPFCPDGSSIYQLFGSKEKWTLQVSDRSSPTWDDCLARLSLDSESVTSSIQTAGGRIIILANKRKSGLIYIFNASTFDPERRMLHPERVFKIHVDKTGKRLISYGFSTARIWDMSTGECVQILKNPNGRPRPQSFHFSHGEDILLSCSEDRFIRSCSLSHFGVEHDLCHWDALVKINETTINQASTNAPICSSFSPDGRMIAFGYRRRPVIVWELLPEAPDLVRQCEFSIDVDGNPSSHAFSSEVVHLEWHPFGETIFGLQREGSIFKWEPLYADEPSSMVAAGAHFMTISPEGSLLATGDTYGTIKVYASGDFSLIYQLSSSDPVLQLCFSTDSRRLYDIRGSYANVWEPSILVRLAENSDPLGFSSDSVSETNSLAKVSLIEHHSSRTECLTAISGQPNGDLYICGTEDGSAFLGQVGRGRILELEQAAGFMSTEQLAWSNDGRLVALANLSGRISVSKIALANEPSKSSEMSNWEAEKVLQITLPQHGGRVEQLLFHPGGRQLFASTARTLYTIDLQTERLFNIDLMPGTPTMKWCCHPRRHDFLVGFGNRNACIISWKDLQELQSLAYSPPRLCRTATVSSDQVSFYGRWSFNADDELLGRLLVHPFKDSNDILLEVLSKGDESSARVESQYLLFSWSDVDAHFSESEERQGELPCTVLFKKGSHNIRQPLGLLSRRRLVFLDIDRWVCTTFLSPRTSSLENTTSGSSAPQQRQGDATFGRQGAVEVDNTPTQVERYYFLPGDWVAQHESHLCSVMLNGTFLCPRNGEVATVSCAKLTK